MKFNNYLKILISTLITILALALSASAAGQDEIPDIATFLKIGRNIGAQYDPNSGEIYFMSPLSGTMQLYRINKVGWPEQLTVFDNGIDRYKVSYDGMSVVAEASAGGDEQTQLYLIDAKTGRVNCITSRPEIQYGYASWAKDNNGIYYRSNSENLKDFKIYHYDLSTDKETLIFDMAGNNSIADISYDGRYMVIYHMLSNVNSDLYLLDLQTGEYRLVASGEENISYNYPSISADDKSINMVCNKTDDGLMKQARLDIETGEIDIIDPESEQTVELLDYSYDRRYMIRIDDEDGYSKILLRNTDLDKDLPVPDLKGRITGPRLLGSGKMLFTFDSPTRTSDIWEWDWNSSELKQITFATYAGIDRGLFSEPKSIRYKSFDGLEIPAFLYLPPDYNGEPLPFIIRIHGGPAEQFVPYFVRNFQYFMLNGYGLLVPNIRGSLGYGKEYADLDNYKKRMDAIKDVKAGAEYLLENGYTEAGRIAVMGPSYGGFVVLASIIEYPDLFSAAIDRTGISNFVTYLNNTKSYRRELRESEYGPLADSAYLESISPLNKADQIKTPLLIIHGENDTRVPISEARQMIEAVKSNGGIVDSLIFPDEGHLISKQENRDALYRKVVEFLNKYLK